MEIKNLNEINRQLSLDELKSVGTNKSTTKKPKSAVENTGRSDEITISEEGKKALEIQRYTQIAKQIPSVRPEELQRVRDRMASGFYSEPGIVSTVAERLMQL